MCRYRPAATATGECGPILDDGDEVVIPEPFYPNYHTSVTLAGATIHPVPTCVEEYSVCV